MYRLVPCIPLLMGGGGGGGGGLIESVKRMCICDYVKNHTEKGFKQMNVLDSSKTYYLCNCIFFYTFHFDI